MSTEAKISKKLIGPRKKRSQFQKIMNVEIY